MSFRASTKWLTVCLYYNEPWEEFLLKAVKPYADIVMQTGIAERFYFQRCWENGPHIRLWFKGNENILEGMLKPNIEEYFAHFFESRPSFRVEPNYPSDYSDKLKWEPNNSLRYLPNAPAMSCFSGALGLSICEKHYHASSKVVLESLADKGVRWTYDDALSTANKLHLSFAFAVGMDLEEAKQFFQQLFNNWKAGNFSTKEGLEFKEDRSQADRILSFNRIFELQRAGITAFNQALWQSLENGMNLDEEGANEEWIQTTLNINIELGLVQDAGKLKMEECPLEFHSDLKLSPEQEQFWRVYARLIHLTNNRLGIVNGDEGYLFYSLAKSLKQ